jgi:hypothetical protein
LNFNINGGNGEFIQKCLEGLSFFNLFT